MFLVTGQVLDTFKVATLLQLAYSPDLAPSGFFLLLKIKRDLKGNRFNAIPAVRQSLLTVSRTNSSKEPMN